MDAHVIELDMADVQMTPEERPSQRRSSLALNEKLAKGLPKLCCFRAPNSAPNLAKNASHCSVVIQNFAAGATSNLCAMPANSKFSTFRRLGHTNSIPTFLL
jgi:hypothetical protein